MSTDRSGKLDETQVATEHPAALARGASLGDGARFGRYAITRRLAAGGMGAVYEAVHHDLEKRVALKVLHPQYAADEASQARFLREGAAAARIRHPHIVDVTDFGVHEGVAFLVMEFLEGESLAARLAREGALPAGALADVVVPVCAAIAAAHEAGVIHRDLKPANVFLARTHDGAVVPKVVDFGLCALRDAGVDTRLTASNTLVGSPAYMAPEQIQRPGDATPAVDQYALGVLLYECLTGRLPFASASLYVLLGQIAHGQCPRPTALRPELPAALERVILRAMQADPAARFASLLALGAALLPFAGERTRLLWAEAFAGVPASPAQTRPLPGLAVRALVLTDVVDSTALCAELGDARTAELWAAHDRAARDLLVVHHGHEIDKTDGFLLMFDAAVDAVTYAVAYHAALRGLGVTARVGVHVGPVLLRENSTQDVARGAKPLELEGLAKPIAARVMATAASGQTLLTAEARAALGATSFRVESHGHWRLKGVPETLELFELGDQAAPFTPPPDGAKSYRVVRRGELWLPTRAVPHSLPAERDAFVGRQADLVELATRLDDGARLVTVLGIGGTGKTRLVTRHGWTWLGDWPGGVWFCDLADARGGDGIASAVARALDVPLGKDDPIVQLGHALAGRGHCLVILDNFEQVTRHADATLGCWLDRAPEAQFVVTSREVLGLPGEHTLSLAPLASVDATALFCHRAEAARRDFHAGPDEMATIAELVDLLDRLPLAIELAAARVRVMSPAALLARMGQRFALLTSSGGRRDRQATLRATLDWSWELLSPAERAALAQLSVFEGGFTLDALEAVVAAEGAWPGDLLQALVDKSLVRPVADERFDLLVSVKAYAAERLAEDGGRDAAEVRHGAHYAANGSHEALAALAVHGGAARLRILMRDLDNLVAACRRAIARGDGPVAVDALAAAAYAFQLKGPYQVAAALAEEVLALATMPPAERGRACQVAGRALFRAGRPDETLRLLHEALALHRQVGNRRDEGVVVAQLAISATSQGRMEEALQLFEDALVIHRELGNRGEEGGTLGNLGLLCMFQGWLDEAVKHYQEGLAIARELGNRRFEGITVGNLAIVAAEQGRVAEALQHFEEALAILHELGSRRDEGLYRSYRGKLQLEQGQVEAARSDFQSALAIAREVGDIRDEGMVLGHLGLLEARAGRFTEARAALARGEPPLRTVGDRLQLLVLLCRRCECEHLAGDAAAAQAALSQAEAIAATVAAGPESEAGRALANARQLTAR